MWYDTGAVAAAAYQRLGNYIVCHLGQYGLLRLPLSSNTLSEPFRIVDAFRKMALG